MKSLLTAILLLGICFNCFPEEATGHWLNTGNDFIRMCKIGYVDDMSRLTPDETSDGYFCLGMFYGLQKGIEESQYVHTVLQYPQKQNEPKDKYHARLQQESKKIDVFCIPPSVTLGQQIKITKKYLDDNPQRLHTGIAATYTASMRMAFPCPK